MGSEYFERPIFVDIVLMMAAYIGVIGNLLVCITVIRVKHLHNLTNYLILNLAISDLLTCLTFLLQSILEVLDLPSHNTITLFNHIYCHVIYSGYLFYSFSFASVYNLVIISFERYVAIVYPLRYGQMCTGRRVGVAVLAAWVAGFLQYLIHLFGIYVDADNFKTKHCTYNHYWAWHFIPFVLGFLLPLAAMLWTYYKIIKTLKLSARQQTAPNHANELITARRRVIHLMLLVTAIFVVFYGMTQPMQMIMVIVAVASEEYETVESAGTSICYLLYLFGHGPAMLTSVLNPIVYAFKYKAFRRGMREGLCPCLNRARTLVLPTKLRVSTTVSKSSSDSPC